MAFNPPPIEKNKDLQAFNTLAIPAQSRWFIQVDSLDGLRYALDFVRQEQCPLLIIGGGSNLVLPDLFPGLVLCMAIKGRECLDQSHEHVRIALNAGESWHDSVMWTVANQWYGIENLALIPGSVGAAPIQNIGAYGVELADCFDYLEAFDSKTGGIVRLDKAQCQFAYRDSIFKHRQGKPLWVITRVVLKLNKQAQFKLSYPALKQALPDKPEDLSLQQVSQAVIAIRNSKLPDPKQIPNAGSFFKNPIVEHRTLERLRKQYPELVAYKHSNNQYKLAAGWLIDHAGWKGKIEQGLGMHKNQALVLTNPGRNAATQVLAFTAKVQQSIQSIFGVYLEVEPHIVSGAQLVE